MTLFLLLLGLVVALGLTVIWRQWEKSQRLQKQLHDEFITLQQEKQIIYSFLRDLGEAFSEEVNRDQLLQIILRCVQRVSNAQGVAVYLWNEDHTQLRAEMVLGKFPPPLPVDTVVAERIARHPGDLITVVKSQIVEPHSRNLIAEVARTRQGFLVERAELDNRFPWFGEASLRTRSYMAVPLHYREDQHGVLALANPDGEIPFSKSSLDIVQSVADQAAYSLHNAQVYHQLAEKRRLDRDIEVAREIQRMLLPQEAPRLTHFQTAARNIAAQQVSGDYFDFIPIGPEQCGVVVADVSGKGIPASLIMTMCRSVLRSIAPGQSSPAQVLREVNRLLFPDIRADMFITLTYAILQPDGHILLARAGHEAPLFLRAETNEVESIAAPGLALGIDRGDVFDEVIQDVSLTLQPHDTLMIYTDGINEALDDAGQEFGLERVKNIFAQEAKQGVVPLVNTLVQRVQDFSEGHPQHDDITLAVVQRI